MPQNNPTLSTWEALRRDKRTTPLHRVVAASIVRAGRVPVRDAECKIARGPLFKATPKQVRAAVDELRSLLKVAA